MERLLDCNIWKDVEGVFCTNRAVFKTWKRLIKIKMIFNLLNWTENQLQIPHYITIHQSVHLSQMEVLLKVVIRDLRWNKNKYPLYSSVHKLDTNYILALLWSFFFIILKGPKGKGYYGLSTINALGVNKLARWEVQQNFDGDTWNFEAF